jgi:pimeloyl-ACP methyl ester carboxylesterase
MSSERIVRANGVDLCVETFGDPEDPAILLMGGAAASMDWWDDEFCVRLAAGRRFVVRYDNRDTGRSVSYPPGAPLYTSDDLLADAVGLLDVLGLDSAHVVGISMGGGLAQELALDHPHRVRTLTLISTSRAVPGGPDAPQLPPPSEEVRALFADEPPAPDWTDRKAVIDYIVEGQRPYFRRGFDEAHLRELAGRIVDRTTDIEASLTNHWLLNDDAGDDVSRRPGLGQISAPTLVMHGTADPMFPYGHGEALAREIPGARLLPLEGVGHQVPPPDVWDEVIPALLRHTGSRRT